jgi:hypothetical protein
MFFSTCFLGSYCLFVYYGNGCVHSEAFVAPADHQKRGVIRVGEKKHKARLDGSYASMLRLVCTYCTSNVVAVRVVGYAGRMGWGLVIEPSSLELRSVA